MSDASRRPASSYDPASECTSTKPTTDDTTCTNTQWMQNGPTYLVIHGPPSADVKLVQNLIKIGLAKLGWKPYVVFKLGASFLANGGLLYGPANPEHKAVR